MEITRVEAVEARGGHRFRATFDTGHTVEVTAVELQNYTRFQRKVLEETGTLFRYESAEEPRYGLGRQAWQGLVQRLLAKAQAAGAHPTPQEE